MWWWRRNRIVPFEGRLVCAAPVLSPQSHAAAAVIEWRVFVRRHTLTSSREPQPAELEEYIPLDGPPLAGGLLVGELGLEAKDGLIPIPAAGLSVRFSSRERELQYEPVATSLRELCGERSAEEGRLCYAERLLRAGARVRLEAVVERVAPGGHPYRGAVEAYRVCAERAPVRLIQL